MRKKKERGSKERMLVFHVPSPQTHRAHTHRRATECCRGLVAGHQSKPNSSNLGIREELVQTVRAPEWMLFSVSGEGGLLTVMRRGRGRSGVDAEDRDEAEAKESLLMPPLLTLGERGREDLESCS
eukprot:2075015-Rhodomonas_salina.1